MYAYESRQSQITIALSFCSFFPFHFFFHFVSHLRARLSICSDIYSLHLAPVVFHRTYQQHNRQRYNGKVFFFSFFFGKYDNSIRFCNQVRQRHTQEQERDTQKLVGKIVVIFNCECQKREKSECEKEKNVNAA